MVLCLGSVMVPVSWGNEANPYSGFPIIPLSHPWLCITVASSIRVQGSVRIARGDFSSSLGFDLADPLCHCCKVSVLSCCWSLQESDNFSGEYLIQGKHAQKSVQIWMLSWRWSLVVQSLKLGGATFLITKPFEI